MSSKMFDNFKNIIEMKYNVVGVDTFRISGFNTVPKNTTQNASSITRSSCIGALHNMPIKVKPNYILALQTIAAYGTTTTVATHPMIYMRGGGKAG